jgi:hypothetical protein
MITIVLGLVLPWLLIAIGGWLAHELVRQNGRILLKLESIEQQLGLGAERRAGTRPQEAGGLPLGTLAPDFELPDLAGVRRKLSEFRKQNVLLIFFNPQCGSAQDGRGPGRLCRRTGDERPYHRGQHWRCRGKPDAGRAIRHSFLVLLQEKWKRRSSRPGNLMDIGSTA